MLTFGLPGGRIGREPLQTRRTLSRRARRYAVNLLAHRTRVTIDVNVSQLLISRPSTRDLVSERRCLGAPPRISQSRSFDQRFRAFYVAPPCAACANHMRQYGLVSTELGKKFMGVLQDADLVPAEFSLVRALRRAFEYIRSISIEPKLSFDSGHATEHAFDLQQRAAGAGGRKDWTVPHAIEAGDSRRDSRPLPWSSSPVGARCERCKDCRRPRGYGCRRRHAARAEAAASVSLGFTNRHHIRIFRRDFGGIAAMPGPLVSYFCLQRDCAERRSQRKHRCISSFPPACWQFF